MIVAEDGDDVVLLVEGYDLGPGNRFKAGTPRETLESTAELLVEQE